MQQSEQTGSIKEHGLLSTALRYRESGLELTETTKKKSCSLFPLNPTGLSG